MTTNICKYKAALLVLRNILILLVIVTPWRELSAISFVEQVDPFSISMWSGGVVEGTHYGELTGWPHTFAFYVSTTTQMRLETAVPESTQTVSVLLVKEQERGVAEVARQTGSDLELQAYRDRYGVSLYNAPALNTTIEPGFYRLEVSNAENVGKYQVTLNEYQRAGYWQTLHNTFAVHNFYGSWFTALFSWRILILWLPLVLAFTWFLTRRRYA